MGSDESDVHHPVRIINPYYQPVLVLFFLAVTTRPLYFGGTLALLRYDLFDALQRRVSAGARFKGRFFRRQILY